MPRGAAKNTLRIIAGHWRGRKLPVIEVPGLRPTKDAVRETLFNWLAAELSGARCLDLFAGSGALGFEAASRGASEVVLVEKEHKVAAQLRANVDLLQASQISVVCQPAQLYLQQPARTFDIVLLDPPFAEGLLPAVLARLEEGGWLHEDSLLYLEDERSRGLPALPPGWTYRREKRAGQVVFGLAEKSR